MDPTLSTGLLLQSPVSTVLIAGMIYAEIPSVLQVIGVELILGAVAHQNGLFQFLTGRKPSAKPDVPVAGEVYDKQQDDTLAL